MSSGFAVDFTEDILATRASPCDRCGQIIPIGQPRHYVRSKISGRQGKFVCALCLDIYIKRAMAERAVDNDNYTGESNYFFD